MSREPHSWLDQLDEAAARGARGHVFLGATGCDTPRCEACARAGYVDVRDFDIHDFDRSNGFVQALVDVGAKPVYMLADLTLRVAARVLG